MVEGVRPGAAGRPGAPAGGLPAGEVTFLFTDIEGSTPLFHAHGAGYAELLRAHNRLISEAVARRGGTVLRTEGDAFFVVFPDAISAVAAAVEAQLALAAHPWPEDGRIRVRMGLHTGEAHPTGEEYVSLVVHQAARVADAGHGGQLLVSEATLRAVADRLPEGTWAQSVGQYRLRGFPEPAELYQLHHPDLPGQFPALRAHPAAAHNVPEMATLFVGRETALAELTRLVRSRRLVTLLGAGGVGKTRLAVELAPRVVESFPDGVWLVELARVGRGARVAPEVAGTLGIRTGPDEENAVVDALREKRMLLVLDNCEHVIEPAARLAEAVVARCPQVSVLCTSREPLGLGMEQRYPLAPLDVPPPGRGSAFAGSEAVALFVDRARAVAPGFDIDRDAESVVEICRRLDGLPLAIELAAARAGGIPVAALASRIDQRFSLLRQGRHGSVAHHETLAASIQWSVELLEPEERTLFRRLGVFRGEFDLDAAEDVCSLPPLAREDLLDLLARLVEKSLVHLVDRRYVLLESIRAFALGQIDDDDERERLRVAHLAHYAELAAGAAAAAHGAGERPAYDRLEAELGNLRAAIEFAFERGDPLAVRIASSLGQFGFVRNHLAEVARWCTRAAGIPDAPVAWRSGAAGQAGYALIALGVADRGYAMLDKSLALARSAGDPRLLGDALLLAAELRLETGAGGDAAPLAREALELAEELGEPLMLGLAMFLTVRCAGSEVGHDERHRRLAEALRHLEAASARREVGRVSLTMAFLSLAAGDLDAAEAEARRTAEVAEELDHRIGGAVATLAQVWVALDRGDVDGAAALHAAVLPGIRQSAYVALLNLAAATAAAIAVERDDAERAVRLLGALAAQPGGIGGEAEAAISGRVEHLRSRLNGLLGEERFRRLAAEGAALPLGDLL